MAEIIETNIFDQEEIHPNCTVQILRNSITGEISIGWWPNDNKPIGTKEGNQMGICSSCAHRPLCRDVTPAMAKCSGFDPVFNAIKTAVDRYGADAQKKVFFGEVGELMTAISDTDRGRDNVEHITEELADVMVCMKQIAYIYGIKQAALLTAVHNKTTRLAHRLAEEDASVRNSNILDEVPSVVDALDMCSSDKCSDKCRYYGRPECCGGLMEDAAVLIEELSARNGGGSK